MFLHPNVNHIQNGGLQATRLQWIRNKIWCISLTLLSPALDGLLISFPLSLFLLLDLDLVMFCSIFDQNRADDTKNSQYSAGNDLFSHNASTKRRETWQRIKQRVGGNVQACKFHGCWNQQVVSHDKKKAENTFKSRTYALYVLQGNFTLLTSYCEWRTIWSILENIFFRY